MAPAGAEATRIQAATMEHRATALLMVPPFLRQASSYSGRREGANRGGRLRGGCSLHPGLGASLPDRPDGQPGHCEHDLGPQDQPGDIHGRLPLPVPLAEDERAYRPGGEAETGPPSLALGGVTRPAAGTAPDHRGRDDRHPVPLVGLAEHPLHGQGVPRAGDHIFDVHGTHLLCRAYRSGRRRVRAPYDLGICLPGSTNGIGTTVASRSPSEVATRSGVPSSESATRVQAKPMFRSSRGDHTAEVTSPTRSPFEDTGHLVVFMSRRSPVISTPTTFRVTPSSRIRRRASLPMNSASESRSTSRSRTTSFDLGPWIWSGAASISRTWTSRPACAARPNA